MEDLSSLVWLGIAVLWVLTRIARRGVKKARREKMPGSRPQPARPATRPGGAAGPEAGSQPEILGRGSSGPPPIVPR